MMNAWNIADALSPAIMPPTIRPAPPRTPIAATSTLLESWVLTATSGWRVTRRLGPEDPRRRRTHEAHRLTAVRMYAVNIMQYSGTSDETLESGARVVARRWRNTGGSTGSRRRGRELTSPPAPSRPGADRYQRLVSGRCRRPADGTLLVERRLDGRCRPPISWRSPPKEFQCEFEPDGEARLASNIAPFFEAHNFVRGDPGPFPLGNAASASTARILVPSHPAQIVRLGDRATIETIFVG